MVFRLSFSLFLFGVSFITESYSVVIKVTNLSKEEIFAPFTVRIVVYYQFVFSVIFLFGFESRTRDIIVLVLVTCLSCNCSIIRKLLRRLPK